MPVTPQGIEPRSRSEDAVPTPAISKGVPLPLGAHLRGSGTNFTVFSRHATGVTLLLFNSQEDLVPQFTITLDPCRNRTGDIWHIWVDGMGAGSLYAWWVDGPYAPAQGDRFNRQKVLLDPYAKVLVGTDRWNVARASSDDESYSSEDDMAEKPKCLVPDDYFDWEDERPPRHSWSDMVIYETHVRGLTIHPSSTVEHPGTFLGVVEMIPYLQDLGITAIELLPVQEFFENELDRRNPRNGERLSNYWGYSPVAFFAPKESYSTRSEPGCQVGEFKTMVRALHRAGIEVILDIVFNHTAEGDHTGPTLNFRGLDNRIYYLLENDRRFYKNYTGTGNTLNCNHPVVRDYILDCLRYWVMEMHVDGFRFDLASVMERDEDGNLLPNPPILERIAEDPILHSVKLIAEAWDAAGVYQVGHFPGQRWSEWNGRYRDDVRRFWRGDPGMAGALASRLCGSADLYQQAGKEPLNSINYLACHDGFTLNDLVSYAFKHNEVNDEGNRDGSDENYSANYGAEGPSDDPEIESLRRRQIKNMLATLMLSRGVPMLLGGDEFRRSQNGNNNAYCQDNETSWYDWSLLQEHRETYEFTRAVISLRRRFALLSEERFYTGDDITWFDEHDEPPDWNSLGHTLGCHLHPEGHSDELCLFFNVSQATAVFKLPQPRRSGTRWHFEIDTANDNSQQRAITETCSVMSRSLVVLSAVH
jgi:isoamylase